MVICSAFCMEKQPPSKLITQSNGVRQGMRVHIVILVQFFTSRYKQCAVRLTYCIKKSFFYADDIVLTSNKLVELKGALQCIKAYLILSVIFSKILTMLAYEYQKSGEGFIFIIRRYSRIRWS